MLVDIVTMGSGNRAQQVVPDGVVSRAWAGGVWMRCAHGRRSCGPAGGDNSLGAGHAANGTMHNWRSPRAPGTTRGAGRRVAPSDGVGAPPTSRPAGAHQA